MRSLRFWIPLLPIFLALPAGCGVILGIDVDHASVVDGGDIDVFSPDAPPVDAPPLADVTEAGPPDAGWWTPQNAGSAHLRAIWGNGPKSIWAAGSQQILYSAGDGTWVKQTIPAGAPDYYGLWGARGAVPSIWAVGSTSSAYAIAHSTGNGIWNEETLVHDAGSTPGNLLAVWGSGATDIYAVGAAGTILHSKGDGQWTPQTSGQGAVSLDALWGSAFDDIYVVGSSAGVILHSTGDGNWMPQSSGVTDGAFTAIWGSGSHDIYAVGTKSTTGEPIYLHSTGDGNWTRQASSPTASQPKAIWGSDSSDVYAAGTGGVILHSKGDGQWNASHAASSFTASPLLTAIWGSGAGDVYITSDDGTIFHGY